ncbi:hypothetical protein TanjilG_10065 [Lupinus angustifolius]|uniref:Uncharacterized protein n=1 Tax=Lupinus angustifolius TaxID=3871 RepID=A0A1J7GGC0_LUPAN|nr:hypothetical protein TanjilG_10065 [Lupinus angustifolius]
MVATNWFTIWFAEKGLISRCANHASSIHCKPRFLIFQKIVRIEIIEEGYVSDSSIKILPDHPPSFTSSSSRQRDGTCASFAPKSDGRAQHPSSWEVWSIKNFSKEFWMSLVSFDPEWARLISEMFHL